MERPWHQEPEHLLELQRTVEALPTAEELAGLGTNTWGEPAAFDVGALHFNDVEDKNTLPLIYGWAVRGSLKERCVNSLGQRIPCEFHLEPDDLSYDSLTGADFNSAVLGRCGALDTATFPPIVLASLPCIYPSTSTNKVWTWHWNEESCGGSSANDNALRAVAREAFRDRMVELQDGTGWDFVEVESQLGSVQTANLVIYCATGSQRSAMTTLGTSAVGFPFGPILFNHAASHRIEETCSVDARFTSLQVGDEAWSYGQGRVALNWDLVWSTIRGEREVAGATCAAEAQADSDFAYHAWKSILAHEVGHVLGFVHQHDTSDDSNLMSPRLSCSLLSNQPGFRPNMKDALSVLSIPDNAPNLTVLSTDLSCYRPN